MVLLTSYGPQFSPMAFPTICMPCFSNRVGLHLGLLVRFLVGLLISFVTLLDGFCDGQLVRILVGLRAAMPVEWGVGCLIALAHRRLSQLFAHPNARRQLSRWFVRRNGRRMACQIAHRFRSLTALPTVCPLQYLSMALSTVCMPELTSNSTSDA